MKINRDEAMYGTRIVYMPRRNGRKLPVNVMHLYRLHRRRWGWIRNELLKELKSVRGVRACASAARKGGMR